MKLTKWVISKHRDTLTLEEAITFIRGRGAFAEIMLEQNEPEIFNELFHKLMSSHSVLHSYKDVSEYWRGSENAIFNGMARYQNAQFSAKLPHVSVHEAHTKDTGVTPVSQDEQDLGLNVAGTSGPVEKHQHTKEAEVDISMVVTTDTGVNPVSSKKSDVPNVKYVTYDDDVKGDAVIASSYHMEEK